MPKSYAHYVDEMLGLAKLRYDNTQVPSLPEFAQKVGHEVIRELMDKDSKAVMQVMKQLIQDGADWYIAFEQRQVARARTSTWWGVRLIRQPSWQR